VERSAYRQENCAFCTGFFQSNKSLVYCANGTGNYNLAGAVKVYCLYCFAAFSFHAAADFNNFIAVHAKYGSHAAFAYRNCFLHELASFAYNAYGICKIKCFCLHQCGIFTQAVACCNFAGYAVFGKNSCTGNAGS
jgi:hypothetical protein